jgi:hypothetical protein
MEDAWHTVSTRQMLGEIAEELGWSDEARKYYEANLDHFARMGDGPGQDSYRERLEHLDERVQATGSDPFVPAVHQSR